MHSADSKTTAEMDAAAALVASCNSEKRNAMSLEMRQGLDEALSSLEKDDTVRVVVLAGAGQEAFVTDADISQADARRTAAQAQREYHKCTHAGRERLANLTKPTTRAHPRLLPRGGLALALAADLRIAGADSSFRIPAAKLGIAYGFERTHQLIGPGHACRISRRAPTQPLTPSTTNPPILPDVLRALPSRSRRPRLPA